MGMLWSLGAAVAGQGSTLIVALVTARILGASAFGELAVVNSTLGMLGTFAGLGLGVTATKFVAELKHQEPERVGTILKILDRAIFASTAFMATVMFLLAPFLANQLLAAPTLVDELRIGCPLIVLNGIVAIQSASLAGYEAFRQIARIALIRGLVALPVSILGAALFGLKGAIVTLGVVTVVNLVIGRRALEREKARWSVDGAGGSIRKELPILWQYSTPAFIGAVLVGAVGWVGTALLVNQPNGYVELGVFNAASQWRTTVLFIPNVVGYTALPIMASLMGVGGSRSAIRVLLASTAANEVIVLPMAAGLFLLRGQIMALYGPAFAPYGSVLGVVAITIVVMSLQLPVGQLLAASGWMWLAAATNVGWAVVFVTSAFVLISAGLGAVGLAAAYLIAYAAHALWTLAAAWYVMRAIQSSGDAPPPPTSGGVRDP
jgi:O-antigen/teichoic acid export membrane protein